jgi:hypothetical protein
MADINGIPYVEATDLVSAYPGVSLALATELDDQLASKAAYPSGGTDGDMLVKDGTSTDWVTPSVAGLTLITSETFSAVSSVSVNGCFTSTYRNYQIVMRVSGNTTGFRFRLRASGTDNTGATSYFVALTLGGGTTINAANSNSFWQIGNIAGQSVQNMIIIAPQVATNTGFICSTVANGSPALVGTHGGDHDQATSYDGFTIFPDGGNITGNLRVYGYKD